MNLKLAVKLVSPDPRLAERAVAAATAINAGRGRTNGRLADIFAYHRDMLEKGFITEEVYRQQLTKWTLTPTERLQCALPLIIDEEWLCD